jgi:hypothetical protein
MQSLSRLDIGQNDGRWHFVWRTTEVGICLPRIQTSGVFFRLGYFNLVVLSRLQYSFLPGLWIRVSQFSLAIGLESVVFPRPFDWDQSSLPGLPIGIGHFCSALRSELSSLPCLSIRVFYFCQAFHLVRHLCLAFRLASRLCLAVTRQLTGALFSFSDGSATNPS